MCISSFGNDLFHAYPCPMSVQSFDHLFTSGPMHSALAVMHCFGNLAFSINAHEPDFQRTRGTAHLICDQKIRMKFRLVLWSRIPSYQFLSKSSCIPSSLTT